MPVSGAVILEVLVTPLTGCLSVPLMICRVVVLAIRGARDFGAESVTSFAVLRTSRLGGLGFGAMILATD